MAIFNSYVKLPEGNLNLSQNNQCESQTLVARESTVIHAMCNTERRANHHSWSKICRLNVESSPKNRLERQLVKFQLGPTLKPVEIRHLMVKSPEVCELKSLFFFLKSNLWPFRSLQSIEFSWLDVSGNGAPMAKGHFIGKMRIHAWL